MTIPKLRGVLLCEDQEHERFFRPLLSKWFGRGKLKVNNIPNNKGTKDQGAGDAYVIAKYAEEVQLARRKRNENRALVVVVDGDRIKIHNRLRQLDQQLIAAGFSTREKDEKIAIFVPTRSVETWELWLCGDREVDEEGDYKNRLRQARGRSEASVKSAIEAWFKPLSSEEEAMEEGTLPALSAGRTETQRLESGKS